MLRNHLMKQTGNTTAAGVVAVLIAIIAAGGYLAWKDAAISLAKETLTRAENFNKYKGKSLDNKQMLHFTKYYTELKKMINEDWPNPHFINLMSEKLNELMNTTADSKTTAPQSKNPEIKYIPKCDCSQSRWSLSQECQLACGKSMWE